MNEELKERLARAAMENMKDQLCGKEMPGTVDIRRVLEAILAELAAAGYAVVEVEQLETARQHADHYLDRLKYRSTGGHYGTKPNGFSYAEVPDWALKQLRQAMLAAAEEEG